MCVCIKSLQHQQSCGASGPAWLPKIRALGSAHLQLQLKQINNPLLKMKRLMQRAGGHTVPDYDSLQALNQCSSGMHSLSAGTCED